MNWTETIVGGTRTRLLELLRRSRRSINDLAAALGITDNAVRTHVAAMQRDGMVQPAGVERATGGKPAQLYEITPEAEELFPKAYPAVLGGLVRAIAEEQGEEVALRLLRRVGRRAAAGTRASGVAPAARVEAAAVALRGLGGDVEVVPTEAGWEIRGFGCPLSAAVRADARVCCLAEAMVQEITGGEVVEACDRQARPRCAFRVSFPDGPGTSAPAA